MASSYSHEWILIHSLFSWVAGQKYPDPDRADAPTMPKRSPTSIMCQTDRLTVLQKLDLPGQAWSPVTTIGSLCCFWALSASEVGVKQCPETPRSWICTLFLYPYSQMLSEHAMQIGLHSWGKGSSTSVWLLVVPFPLKVKKIFCLDIRGQLQKRLTYSLSMLGWQKYLEECFTGGPCQNAQGTLRLKVTLSEGVTKMLTKQGLVKVVLQTCFELHTCQGSQAKEG